MAWKMETPECKKEFAKPVKQWNGPLETISHNIKRIYNIQNQNKSKHLKNYRNLKKI